MWEIVTIGQCSYALIKDKKFESTIALIASKEQVERINDLLNTEDFKSKITEENIYDATERILDCCSVSESDIKHIQRKAVKSVLSQLIKIGT